MSGTDSSQYTLTIPVSELGLEAFERIQKPTPELTPEQMTSLSRSLIFINSSWANRGINLFTVTEYKIFMPRGTREYIAPPQIVDILPDSVILRKYLMGAPVSVFPQFTTTAGSALVTIAGFGETPSAGQFISVGIQVSVGGIILYGFYQVVSVPGSGQATIDARVLATMTSQAQLRDSAGNPLFDSAGNPIYGSVGGPAVPGGVVPVFASTLNSNIITVTFPDHGLLTGQPFFVAVTTTVGGVMLLGPYPITYLNPNMFTIQAPYPAGFAEVVGENSNNTYLSTQSAADDIIRASWPEDIPLYPLSRTEYMSIPNKGTEGRTTSFYINRQISPRVLFWPVFDENGPYEVVMKASQYIQAATISGASILQVPMRFWEAFSCDLAFHLSRKWAPQRSAALKVDAAEEWARASDEDIERVSTFLQPDMAGYFT